MAIQNNFPAIKPSLMLDFANTKELDPRITFTRASTATFYNGVTTAKAEENLLLQSQAWATTPWFVNIGGSVTAVNNAATAPDGTTTATSLTFSAQFGSQAQSVTTISGLSYTFSFWAKRISGNTALHINHFDSATGANTTFTITNDWVRYSVTVLGKSGGGAVQFGVQDRNASGFGEIQIWGAQLEQRTSVTAYTATTTQPITNYIPVLQTAASGVARFEHNPVTGESLGLEIEEQRTNLVTYSEQFDNAAWTKQQSSVTANTVIAPDGALTGDVVIQDTATNVHGLTGTIAVTSGTTYTWSVFAKAQAATVLQLTFGNASSTFSGLGFANFDLSAGTVSATGGTLVGSGIQAVGNGWYRCFITATATATATSNNWIAIANSTTSARLASYTGNGYSGIFIWGAQLEAGAFATSYIPTVASQVTRAADAASMTGTNFSSWYNQAEGAVYVEAQTVSIAATRGIFAIGDSTLAFGAANTIYSVFDSGLSGRISQNAIIGGANQVPAISPSYTQAVNTATKMAQGYKVNDYAITVNAVTPVVDTSALVPVVSSMSIGSLNSGWSGGGNFLNGTIRKIAYYPLRVSNNNLQALTS